LESYGLRYVARYVTQHCQQFYFMKGILLVIIIIALSTLQTKADDFGIKLYHVKIELLNKKIVDGYFLVSSYYSDSPTEFKSSDELKAFVLRKTIYTSDILKGMYQRKYKILDYQCIDDWIRGQIVLLKDNELVLRKTDLLSVQLVNVTNISGVEIANLSSNLVKFLIREPQEMVTLNLDDKLTIIGDNELRFILVSYSKNANIDLKKIKEKIETRYFFESKECDDMNVFQAWQPIFREYKDELAKDDIFLIELTLFF
jgi:hypothetical protein